MRKTAGCFLVPGIAAEILLQRAALGKRQSGPEPLLPEGP